MVFRNELLVSLKRFSAERNRRTTERTRRTFKLEDFSVVGTIGAGRFGVVYLATDMLTGFLVAIKVVDLTLFESKEHQLRLYHEIFLHSMLDHPNIVNHYSHFYGPQEIFCVQEFAPRGTLYERLLRTERLPKRAVAKCISQIANALHHCHLLGFVHGDIKPENILIDDFGDVKLSDFGFAWPNDVSSDISMCATPEYCPPEVLREKDYEFPGDVWSLGVLFYELSVGSNPFFNLNPDIMKAYILSAAVRSSPYLDPKAYALVTKMLSVRPCDRLTLVQVMSHEWIVERTSDISTFCTINKTWPEPDFIDDLLLCLSI